MAKSNTAMGQSMHGSGDLVGCQVDAILEVRKLPHRTLVLHDKQNIYIEQQCMTPVSYLCYPSRSKACLSVLRTWGGGTCSGPSAIATGMASHPRLICSHRLLLVSGAFPQ